MSTQEFTNKVVTCRKEHRCEWCPDVVEKGTKAHYRAGVFDGDFYSGHLHPECYTAIENSSDEAHEWMRDSGFMPHDQLRGKTYDESHA